MPRAVGHSLNLRGCPARSPRRSPRALYLKQHALPTRRSRTRDAGIAATGCSTACTSSAAPCRATRARAPSSRTSSRTAPSSGRRRARSFRTYENMRWRRLRLRELALDDPDAAFGELKMFEGDPRSATRRPRCAWGLGADHDARARVRPRCRRGRPAQFLAVSTAPPSQRRRQRSTDHPGSPSPGSADCRPGRPSPVLLVVLLRGPADPGRPVRDDFAARLLVDGIPDALRPAACAAVCV